MTDNTTLFSAINNTATVVKEQVQKIDSRFCNQMTNSDLMLIMQNLNSAMNRLNVLIKKYPKK